VTGPNAASSARVESIDVVRGVIMIVMALDHVRDFFGAPGANPTDPLAPARRSSSRAGSLCPSFTRSGSRSSLRSIRCAAGSPA
jgi:uncharacterized membrane protein